MVGSVIPWHTHATTPHRQVLAINLLWFPDSPRPRPHPPKLPPLPCLLPLEGSVLFLVFVTMPAGRRWQGRRTGGVHVDGGVVTTAPTYDVVALVDRRWRGTVVERRA